MVCRLKDLIASQRRRRFVRRIQLGGAPGTTFWVDPVEDIVVVAMIQLMSSPCPLSAELKSLTYQAITELNRKR